MLAFFSGKVQEWASVDGFNLECLVDLTGIPGGPVAASWWGFADVPVEFRTDLVVDLASSCPMGREFKAAI